MRGVAAAVAEWIVTLAMRDRRTRALLLAPGGEALRWRVGRLRAWRAATRARRQVPAYARHLDIRGAAGARRLEDLPETDKARYIAPNRLEALCRHGRLPRRGVVLDESSGAAAARRPAGHGVLPSVARRRDCCA